MKPVVVVLTPSIDFEGAFCDEGDAMDVAEGAEPVRSASDRRYSGESGQMSRTRRAVFAPEQQIAFFEQLALMGNAGPLLELPLDGAAPVGHLGQPPGGH